MISDEIVSWASACRGIPKQSSKTYSAGRKTSRYSKNRATDYDLGRNCLLGINFRGTPKQSPKTYSGSRKTPRYSQNRATDYDLRQNILLGINVTRYTDIVPKNVLRQSKKNPGTVKTEQQTMIQDEIVSWASMCRRTLKQSSKKYSVGRKTPRHIQNRATIYDLRLYLLLSINLSRHTEIDP